MTESTGLESGAVSAPENPALKTIILWVHPALSGKVLGRALHSVMPNDVQILKVGAHLSEGMMCFVLGSRNFHQPYPPPYVISLILRESAGVPVFFSKQNPDQIVRPYEFIAPETKKTIPREELIQKLADVVKFRESRGVSMGVAMKMILGSPHGLLYRSVHALPEYVPELNRTQEMLGLRRRYARRPDGTVYQLSTVTTTGGKNGND